MKFRIELSTQQSPTEWETAEVERPDGSTYEITTPKADSYRAEHAAAVYLEDGRRVALALGWTEAEAMAEARRICDEYQPPATSAAPERTVFDYEPGSVPTRR